MPPHNDEPKQSDLFVRDVFTKIIPGTLLAATLLFGGAYVLDSCSYIGHGEFTHRTGAVERIIGRPDNEMYHSVSETDNGFVAKLGGCYYLLDEDGVPLGSSCEDSF